MFLWKCYGILFFHSPKVVYSNRYIVSSRFFWHYLCALRLCVPLLFLMSLTPANVPTVSAWSTRLVPKDTTTVKGKTQFVIVPPGRNPAYSTVPTSGFRDYDRDYNHRDDYNYSRRGFRAKKKKKKVYVPASPEPAACGPQFYVYPLPDPSEPPHKAICHPVPFYIPQFLLDPIRFARTEWSQAKENGLVLDQLAYYFSPANLSKDFYLRSLFDHEDGSVTICDLIKLTRLANLLGSDVERLVHVVQCCPFLELLPGTCAYNSGVRVHDWERWVMGSK